jgi:hypothetical protein
VVRVYVLGQVSYAIAGSARRGAQLAEGRSASYGRDQSRVGAPAVIFMIAMEATNDPQNRRAYVALRRTDPAEAIENLVIGRPG